MYFNMNYFVDCKCFYRRLKLTKSFLNLYNSIDCNGSNIKFYGFSKKNTKFIRNNISCMHTYF